jgi:hypothetical protein
MIVIPFLLFLLAPGFQSFQAPRIGIIDFYGVRKVSEKRIREALGVKEGDLLPPSKSDAEVRLEKVPGVVRARLEAVCCEQGKAILYVGIEERGAPHFSYRFPPEKAVTLPEEIAETYHKFLTAVEQSARAGDSTEDLSQGHALAANPEVRALQEWFITYANVHLNALRDVLRNSADSEKRAIAAYVIGYAERKSDVINDLEYALQDPNDSTRYNAIRSLTAIAVLAQKDPEQKIHVSVTWFVEMLNSILWNDRYKAAKALVILTENRDAGDLEQLRNRALLSLIEMARWKSLTHALPSFILLGRVAGIPEQEIHKAWSDGEREATIDKILEIEHINK